LSLCTASGGLVNVSVNGVILKGLPVNPLTDTVVPSVFGQTIVGSSNGVTGICATDIFTNNNEKTNFFTECILYILDKIIIIFKLKDNNSFFFN
jgi:hypothetical protein